MDCPHCAKSIHESWDPLIEDRMIPEPGQFHAPGEPGITVRLHKMECPACHKLIVRLRRGYKPSRRPELFRFRVIYPLDVAERPAPLEVPEQLRSDYGEATAIVGRSPQASAALSRRIVQQVLGDQGGYQKRDLSEQIQNFIDDPRNPSGLKQNLDYLREIGNFAAHTMKSESTGEVLPVEPGEAEWAIDVVDGLFDLYFVAPARDAERRRAFDQRIEEAGRRPLTTES